MDMRTRKAKQSSQDYGHHTGVSTNRGTLKRMVYNGKPYQNG